ncbi:hypothetical protein A4F85_04615 [Delftia sp. GW456-R20]|nr:hypothetical protein A4F85_04615 [Delftia sp. GW456-R20]
MEAPASTKWAFGLNDFTVECFINLALMPSGYYYSPMGNWSSSGGWCFFVRPNGFLSFHNVGTVAVSAADSIKLKKWQHIAYSRKGSIGRLFIGGRLVAVIDDTVNVTAQSGLRLLGNQTSSDFWRGSVAMPRVTAGVGRYVSDFTQFVEAFPTDVS